MRCESRLLEEEGSSSEGRVMRCASGWYVCIERGREAQRLPMSCLQLSSAVFSWWLTSPDGSADAAVSFPCRIKNSEQEKAKQKELQLFCGSIMEEYDEHIEEAIMAGWLNDAGVRALSELGAKCGSQSAF
eukprot:358763-Chlamydomonas_euryale.AAC.1